MTAWEGRGAPRDLSEGDFRRAADAIGCDVAAIKAVWEVEAAGRHFLPDGSVVRRFEPHHFPRDHWERVGFEPRAGESTWRASVRLSDEAMFMRAVDIDAVAAMTASSWGAPQIMGFNHRDAGFKSAREMVEHMSVSAANQLGAFVQLVETWGIATSIRSHDWTGFARRYNGSGQVSEYARKIERAYRKHSGGLASPVVLRAGDRGAAVVKLQQALGIEDDGAFGPETVARVKQFQGRVGLTADGVVGKKTWDAIKEIGNSEPPAQDDVADHIQREAGKWGAVISTVGAAATSLTDTLEKVPQPVIWFMLAGVLIGGLIWWAKR